MQLAGISNESKVPLGAYSTCSINSKLIPIPKFRSILLHACTCSYMLMRKKFVLFPTPVYLVMYLGVIMATVAALPIDSSSSSTADHVTTRRLVAMETSTPLIAPLNCSPCTSTHCT